MMVNARRSLQELSAEVATNPNSTAFVELAAAYRRRGDLDRALRLCLRGIERHPTHIEAHYELGCTYEARGERELALDEWNIVRQLAPDHLESRLAAARLYMEEGRRADAERELREAESMAPSNGAIAELWKAIRAMPESEAVAKGGRDTAGPDALDRLQLENPGVFGVLLVNADGEIVAGRMEERGGDAEEELGASLSAARVEAERVASYLELGRWRGMVVESGSTRLMVSPVRDGVVAVATAPDLPPGRAARVVRRARELAKAFLAGER